MNENVDSKKSAKGENSSMFAVDQKKIDKKRKLEVNKMVIMQSEEKSPKFLLHLDDLSILTVFTLLDFLSAFKLGRLSRRLYRLYKESYNKRSLLFLDGWNCDKTYKLHIFKNIFCGKASPFPLFITADYLLQPSYVSIAHQLFARLPDLVCLEIKDVDYYKPAFNLLINCLNSSLTKLQYLKLHFRFLNENIKDMKKIDALALQSGITAEKQQLRLPLLKHLALYFIDPENDYVKTVIDSSIFNLVFPQLTSFYLDVYSDLKLDVLCFIHRHVRSNSQLMAAAESGSNNFQIRFDVFSDDDDSNEQFSKKIEDGTVSTEEAGGLTFVTYLRFFNSHIVENPEVFFIQLLTQTPNVRQVCFNFYDNSEDNENMEDYDEKFSYPLVLRILTALSCLEKIKLNFDEYQQFIESRGEVRFRKSNLSVLPSVRSLSLTISSTFHTDPVEFLQLAHCFPTLKQIKVIFHQTKCEYCNDYSDAVDDSAVFQRCGLNLARGLLRLGKTGTGITAWESAVKVKKVEIKFDDMGIKFSSLENLVAGINEEYAVTTISVDLQQPSSQNLLKIL